MTKEQFLQILENDPEFSPGWQPAHFGTNLHARAVFGGDNFWMDTQFISQKTAINILSHMA